MGADDEPVSLTTARVVVGGVDLGSVTIETSATEIAELAATFALLNATGETSVAQPGDGGAETAGVAIGAAGFENGLARGGFFCVAAGQRKRGDSQENQTDQNEEGASHDGYSK